MMVHVIVSRHYSTSRCYVDLLCCNGSRSTNIQYIQCITFRWICTKYCHSPYVERELSSIKRDGVVRDTEWSAKATTLSNQGWVCGTSSLTPIKKAIFIETGIYFRVIKPSFLNLSFPSFNHYLKKRIISINEKMHVTHGVDTTFRYIASSLHDTCQDMSSPMMRVLSTFHVITWDMTTPLSWQDRWNDSIIEIVSSFYPHDIPLQSRM